MAKALAQTPTETTEGGETVVETTSAEPVVETQETEQEVSTAPEETAESTEVEAAPEPTPEPTPEPPKEDWKDKRIAKLTARLAEARKAEAAPQAPDPTADFNRRVAEAAAQQVAAQEYNRKCNEAAKKGKELFGADFDVALTQLRSLVNENDPEEVGSYNQFINAGLETEHLPELIAILGNNLGEASRILALPPVKMGIELAKLALAEPKAAPEPVSELRKPIRPVGGGRGDHLAVDPADPSRADSLSTAEWMKRREASLKEARR